MRHCLERGSSFHPQTSRSKRIQGTSIQQHCTQANPCCGVLAKTKQFSFVPSGYNPLVAIESKDCKPPERPLHQGCLAFSVSVDLQCSFDEDEKFQDTLCETQQQLYEEPLHARQPLVSKARKNRERLGLVIADVIFAENPTSTLAAKSGANIQKWKDRVVTSTWTAMDSNPFTTVRDVNLVFLSHQIYSSNIFCNCILSFSNTRMSPKSTSVCPIDPTMLV
jgi:hypothetical protein